MRRLEPAVRERLLAGINRPRRRDDLLRLGLTDGDLKRLVRNRTLQRFWKWYVDGTFDPEAARVLCALSSYPGAVLSHFTAARLAGLRTWTRHDTSEKPVCLTRTRRFGRRSHGPDLALRVARLDLGDLRRFRVAGPDDPLACLDGAPMTAPARTVVDLARQLPLAEALVTVDHALALMVGRDELENVLDRQCGWPGVQAARQAIGLGDPQSESVLESIARAVFAEAGLPAPVLQAQFFDGERWTPERTDFWWPQFRTHAEADGLAKFEAATPAERRRLHRAAFVREQRLAAHGAELVRFGWEDAVHEPADLVRRLRQAFARGLRRTGPPIRWRVAPPGFEASW
ncbi:hypothetical protein [Kribbella deserti]|uniref:Transcriptional regulator, AbiEi antitoxin, Type IV TA system n=1 Tax=Kribbella deserti TaxID=1926257 RepID=A0ABV6QMH3_9ACTN